MFALEGLAPVDGWAAFAIVAKAMGYGLALLAMGGPLFLLLFGRDLNGAGPAGFVRRITALCAALLLLILLFRFGIRSARISGMGLEGMIDPVMLGFVWDSPLGSAAIWRTLGAVLALLILVPGRWGILVASAGSVLIAFSYAQVGHSLGEPRWLLSALLVLHLLAASFWVGALLPLHRLVGLPGDAALLHRFGRIATVVVGLLVLLGVVFAWLVSGSLTALVATAYGWTLLAKIAIVTVLLGFAALNKLRLVPRLADGGARAASGLRRSIAWEGGAVACILFLTAVLTSVTTPPVNL